MKASHDLSGLVKFLSRDDWAFHFEEVMGDHFWPVMDHFDLDHEEINDALGDHWAMTLWGCAFEDFLTQVFDPGGQTFVEAYLKRRSWKESAQSKAYMTALGTSVMSLYEASEIVPGKSFLARDLIRGGEPVLISEGTATKTLRQWERVAARIVPLGGKLIIAGGLLPFSQEASDALLEGFKALPGKRRRSRTQPLLDDEMLRAAAPLFTHAFLFDVLPKALGETRPIIHNSDGDEIVFHEVRFPLATGITRKDIAWRLQGIPQLRQENAQFWNWLDERSQKGPLKARVPNALAAGTTMEDGTPVLGNLELKGRFLTLMVNSAARAARGREMLENVLGKMVGVPLTTIQTIEQMQEARKGRTKEVDDIPLEVATPLVHAMLDKQYREILDQPVGMLGDISPRSAVGTQKGREKVAEWLKYLEFRSASSQNPHDPMTTYDFGWMWRELNIENLRR
ncbi:hypothetical protein [Chelatococcus asaccharovorans]|uniref:Uncharacterized protein n=1 Tax=Chelatococcus asaccharovorans TaxID=28210 RepID=A0A2V3TRT9_9HYPH|nr:hypothetical protein [Chelatococcus asaccharovorans]MBS7707961.1 hypothetical protein [Chelatococcus asaccharovorans]PXW50277.1 hypothetical protein C7450_1296 [Chelatococcus asaccharovorans]